MKIIKNKIIPFKGFTCITLFGVIFQRSDAEISDTTINHELIHMQQAKDLSPFKLYFVGYLLFYILYLTEWIFKLIISPASAYYSISFEQEAYNNQKNLQYLQTRKRFNWIKYLFKTI